MKSSKSIGIKTSTHFSAYLKKCFAQLSSDLDHQNDSEKDPEGNISIKHAAVNDAQEKEKDEEKEKVKNAMKDNNSDILEITNTFLDLWNLNTQGPGCALVLVKLLKSKVEEGRWTEREDRQEGEGVKKFDTEGKTEGKGKVEIEIELEISISDGPRNNETRGEGGKEGEKVDSKKVSEDEGSEHASAKTKSAPESSSVHVSAPVYVDGVNAIIESLLGSFSLCPAMTHPRLLYVISWLLRPSHADSERSSDKRREGKGSREGRAESTLRRANESEAKESLVLDLFAITPRSANHTSDKSGSAAESKRVMSCVVDWLNVRVTSLLRVEGRMTYTMLMRKGEVLSLLLLEVWCFVLDVTT